jgi:hypothetical protein
MNKFGLLATGVVAGLAAGVAYTAKNQDKVKKAVNSGLDKTSEFLKSGKIEETADKAVTKTKEFVNSKEVKDSLNKAAKKMDEVAVKAKLAAGLEVGDKKKSFKKGDK